MNGKNSIFALAMRVIVYLEKHNNMALLLNQFLYVKEISFRF